MHCPLTENVPQSGMVGVDVDGANVGEKVAPRQSGERTHDPYPVFFTTHMHPSVSALARQLGRVLPNEHAKRTGLESSTISTHWPCTTDHLHLG